jgi:uncharacterized protein YdaU (DUF1376 family)
MYYYQFHIGDYRAATSHLNNEEDLAYRRLLDMYYDTESCIPLDTQWVSRRIRIAHDVVLSVLIDMFQKTESGWFHPVCDRNLKQYIAKAETARTNGKSGGRPKKNPVGSQQEPDGKLTNNHKPITITKTKAVAVARPDDVDQKTWDDFLQIRKAKRAPITETALTQIRDQASKAGLTVDQALRICCARGWQGFEAAWVKPDDRKSVEVDKPGFFMGRKLAGGGHGQP